jgi:bla regulator protein blaR1
MTVDPVIDHLWQSTLFAVAIALLTLTFRRTQARARYWLWFAASLKFLIPFAALTAIGAQFQWQHALPQAPREWTIAFEAVSQPFVPPRVDIASAQMPGAGGLPLAALLGAMWLLGSVVLVALWTLRWRRVSAAARSGSPITSGRVHDVYHSLASPPVLPLVSLDTALEPGVFGIVRPVLLWPRDIDARLDDEQVRAILAHELAHVRRRDNLTALIHMVVEALFWFHPLVWWIVSRLVDERERACDEEVVRLGSDPNVYAESILRTCQYYIESPLSCVPGVTGSDLNKRIERIMTDRPRTSLSVWNRAVLATVAVMTLAAPVAIGALSAPARAAGADAVAATDRPSFEVATVKPNTSGAMRVTMRVLPGGAYEATNVTLESMIRMSYRLQESQIIGGPAWIYRDRFDILAKSAAGVPQFEFSLRMQSLLAERFNLEIRNETRDLPIYALVSARGDGSRGPRLTPSDVDCERPSRGRSGAPPPMPTRPGERPACGTITGPGRVTAGGATMSQIARTLSQYTGRMVIDRTALDGSFNYDLEFAPDPGLRGRGPGGGLPPGPLPEGTAPARAEGASIFTAVQEQLGLRLESQHGPVQVIVVESADQPSEN